jgi:hypothetical protein
MKTQLLNKVLYILFIVVLSSLVSAPENMVVKFGDVNNDGLIDYLKYNITNSNEINLYTYSNNNYVNSNSKIIDQTNSLNTFDNGFALADINNDGYDDLIASMLTNSYIFWNNGTNLSINDNISLSSNLQDSNIHIVDVNNNQNLDIIISGHDESGDIKDRAHIYLMSSSTVSSFQELNLADDNSRTNQGQLLVYDINQDGYFDIIYLGSFERVYLFNPTTELFYEEANIGYRDINRGSNPSLLLHDVNNNTLMDFIIGPNGNYSQIVRNYCKFQHLSYNTEHQFCHL